MADQGERDRRTHHPDGWAASAGRVWDWVRPGDQAAAIAADSVFVVGLGRFGSAMAERLVTLGVEVMAVDTDADLVNQWASRLTHVRVADGSDAVALQQLGVTSFDAAVVAIGTQIEASVLTTSALADAGVSTIWAKAITAAHGRILERVGAHHVVFPERDVGQRVAHIVTGRVLDYVAIDDDFDLVEMMAPTSMVGRTLAQSQVRQRYDVTVVCRKSVGKSFTYVTAETVVGEGDVLLVAGATAAMKRFADEAR